MNEPTTPLTLGAALLDLKERSGLSLAQLASAAGYRSASAIQRFFNADYAPAQPTRLVGRRLAAALSGKGDPPIDELEVLRLFGDTKFAQEADHSAGGGWTFKHDRIPITSATWVAEGLAVADLEFLEVFVRKHSGTVIRAPDHLKGIAMAGFFVPVSNMWPKYEVGEFVTFEASRPVKAGDYAVARLTPEADLRHLNFIARVDRIHRDRISFTQFNPERSFDVPGALINFIARLTTTEDLLPAIEPTNVADTH